MPKYSNAVPAVFFDEAEYECIVVVIIREVLMQSRVRQGNNLKKEDS